jgi:hypothetical protein
VYCQQNTGDEMTETNEAQQQAWTWPEPQDEHRWLQRLVGEWTYESEAMMPDGTTARMTGTETIRPFGDLWIMTDSKGETPGGDQTSTITLGYDPQKQRFVGTFVDTSMTFMWIYEGSLDGDVLTLESDGPSFEADGKMAKYKDITELKNDDYRIFRSVVLGNDGEWHEFMTSHYRRKR